MKTILIVEDDVAIAEFLREMLQDLGYEVMRAGNGREALQQLATQTPHLIITDMMMPIMNGRQLSHEVRSNKRYAHIPIIMMSAINPVVEADAGYTHFLPKPFALEKLIAIVEMLLGVG